MSNQIKPKPGLTPKEFNELAGSILEFRELRALNVRTKQHDARLAGLTEFIADTFFNNAEEFLGAWITVRQEYRPLLNVLATVVNRVSDLLQPQLAALPAAVPTNDAAAAAAAASAEQPGNIVDLNGAPAK